MEAITVCKYLHRIFNVPVFLYENNNLLMKLPDVSYNLPLPEEYLSKLLNSTNQSSYISTKTNLYYGSISIPESNDTIIIGPANSLPLNKKMLFQLHKEFQVSQEMIEEYDTFICGISLLKSDVFFNIIDLIHYFCTNDTTTVRQNASVSESSNINEINSTYFSNNYILNDKEITNNSYQIEQLIFSCIEQGNVPLLKERLVQTPAPNIGIMASNNLRQMKNTFIISMTLASRSAVKGGLPVYYAYRLSDTYIQKMEELNDFGEIEFLTYTALIDFAQRTHENGTPLRNTKDNMAVVIKYVQEHLNEPLSVNSIASCLGYNRSYLSRCFKQELGFDLGLFITRCKLESSCYLLKYSNRSICDISTYLCFSSQSHFQKAFKKQFELTPMQYRNQNKN